MSDLGFVENYKAVRERLNGGKPKTVVIPRPPEVLPEAVKAAAFVPKVPVDQIPRNKILKDPVLREYIRRKAILEEGISYREALLKGAENVPRKVKLVVLPILEDSNFSWEELFGRTGIDNRNARTAETVKVKWEIFRELRTQLKAPINQIAVWCKMDHTSVMHGLGLLKRGKK